MAEVPVQPQPTSKGINWKTILIGAVIGGLVIVIGALGFYLYQGQSGETTSTQVTTPKKATDSSKQDTPTAEKDETADWEKYSNSSLGISLSRPPDATLDSDDSNRVDFFYLKSSSPDYAYKWSFGVNAEDTIRKSLVEVKEAYNNLQGKYENFENISIDGVEALKFKFTREGSARPSSITAVALKDGKEYTISLTLADETLDLEDFDKTFDSILSSIKFLN